ncbi:MAG: tetratricopeptide repeat protein [Lacunisphaera sp.]
MIQTSATPAKQPSTPRRVPVALFVAAIFGVTLLAYYPAIRGGQLWDDAAHITASALQSVGGLKAIWFRLGATQQYYPVLHSAFWLEHRLWGDAVVGYHLVNIALHATAACLFALLLFRMAPADRNQGRRWRTEWLVAAVFALHPVCVESVAWISEQKNTLSAVFYMLAALSYVRFDRDRQWRWYALAFGLFVLALLSKSVTATLPAALLLGFYWKRGGLEWRRDVAPLLPWFVVGLAAGLFTAWVEHNYIGARGEAYDLSFVQRGLLAGRVVWFYFAKLVWPADLIFIYPRWQVVASWAWSVPVIVLGASIAGLWSMRRWSRAPVVAVLFFVGSLFPALGFFNVYPFVFSYVADHWQYLPCLGIIALVVEGGGYGLRRAGVAWVGIPVAVALLAVCFALTWRQAAIYRDGDTLYSATLAKNPDCWLAHNNLGLLLMDAGSLPAAIRHFQEAILLKPDCADAFNNLGNAYSKMPGHAAESIAALEQALRFQPTMAEALSNLGWALVNVPGRLDEGTARLQTALQLRPDLYRTENSLGLALAKIPGRNDEAIAHFETALAADPDFADARINLGNALVRAGRFPEAIDQLERARVFKPTDAGVHFNLGTALASAGKPAEAAAAFERSLHLRPANADAENNLGNVLGQLGHESEAMSHYRKALQIDPSSAETHFNLALALRGAGDGTEAVAHFRESLRLAPEMAENWNSFGSYLYRLGRLPEAVSTYVEAVRLRPYSARYHFNLGSALSEAGHPDEAIVEFKEALRLEPGMADAHYNLGVALQRTGHPDEAAAEYKASGRGQP